MTGFMLYQKLNGKWRDDKMSDKYQNTELIPEERAALLLKAEHAGARAGPSCLSLDATKSMLARTKSKVEALVKIKRIQTAG